MLLFFFRRGLSDVGAQRGHNGGSGKDRIKLNSSASSSNLLCLVGNLPTGLGLFPRGEGTHQTSALCDRLPESLGVEIREPFVKEILRE